MTQSSDIRTLQQVNDRLNRQNYVNNNTEADIRTDFNATFDNLENHDIHENRNTEAHRLEAKVSEDASPKKKVAKRKDSFQSIKKDFLGSLRQTIASAFRRPRTVPASHLPKSILKCKENKTEKSQKFRFNETVLVGETYSREEYKRKGEMKIHMTSTMAFLIRQELNEFKREMEIHVESRHHTHFYA